MDAKPTIRSDLVERLLRTKLVQVPPYGIETEVRVNPDGPDAVLAIQEAREALEAETARAEAALDAALEQQRLREEAREAERAAVFKQVREALEAQRGEWSRAKTFDLLDAIEAGSHLSQESGRG